MSKFIRVRFDLRCKWDTKAPEYRIYVNGELFTERTFKWVEKIYLKEMLQIRGEPGIYEFRIEELDPKTGVFEVSNTCIEVGDARVLDTYRIEIL